MEKHIFKQLYGVLPCVKPVQQRVTFLLSHFTQQQVEIEKTRFLSTVLLCSEFKLENIYSRQKFCTKNVWGDFFSGAYFCRQLAISQKLEHKNFLQLLATRLKYVSYVYVSGTVTRLRTRLILIYPVFILTCSHAIKNDTQCSITMRPICVE